MQIILTPEQMRALEGRAFEMGVPSLLVMEEAARGAHEALKGILGGVEGKRLLYLIGTGNNGGDGMAMARLCLMDGGLPQILLTGAPRSPDALSNLSYAKALGIPIREWTGESGKEELALRPFAVVDAVYGTGFHGALPGHVGRLAGIVNAWGLPVVAMDAPSGMDSLHGEIEGEIFSAGHTLVLGHLKTGLCLTRHPEKAGELVRIPLGLPQKAWEALPAGEILTALEPGDLSAWLPKRKKNAHKGDCGRVLLYMGSLGMSGAAGMAARAALACLRSGAGLVTVACESGLIPTIQDLAPNAMCVPIAQAVKNPPDYDVFALGCGLGKAEGVWDYILALWRPARPSVWDADALNLLAAHPMGLGEKAVITPHPGEAARLLKTSVDKVTRRPLEAAGALREKFGCTVVLKGAVSVIRDRERTALNLTGSPALAKGGSGDALTGVVAALLAQQPGLPPFESARTACLWHGMAGVEAARRLGVLSPLTTDVIDCLGPVSI